MKIHNEVHASMTRLARNIGPEVLQIPIVIDPGARYVAVTNADAVWVSSNIVESEPHNIEVYVAHEITHHVIGDPEQTSKFPPMIVNYAEDFKINQLIEELFGYDVRKVGVPGLRDNKYDKLSVRQVAERLMKEGTEHYRHYAMRMPNKELLAAAEAMRRKFGIGVKKSVFYMDGLDRSMFIDNVNDAVQNQLNLRTLKNVDLPRALEGVWSHLYMERPTHTVPEYTTPRYLRPSQAVAYCVDGSRFRGDTKGDPVKSALAAAGIIRALDLDYLYLTEKIWKAQKRIADYKEELDYRARRPRKRDRMRRLSTKKIKLRLANVTARYDKLIRMQPIHKLMEEQRVVVLPGKRFKMSSLLTAMDELENGEVVVPKLRNTELTKRLKSISRRAGAKFDEYVEASQEVRSTLKDLLNVDDVQKEEQPSIEPDKEVEEDTPAPIPSRQVQISAPLEPSEEPEPREQQQPQQPYPLPPPDDEDGESIDENGDGDGGEGGEESDEESEGSGSGSGKSGDGKKPANGSQGSSSGEDANSEGFGRGGDVIIKKKMDVERRIYQNSGRLLQLIFMMKEMEAMLSSNPRRKPEDNPTIPLGLTYGNDLDNVDTSEFALLANESTRMDFYVRLAQGSLLQRQSLQRKQSAVIMCIDTSGSMMGGRLDRALAFALALANRLAKEKRGFALMMFHDRVYRIIDFHKKPSISRLLDAMSSIRSGGTDFMDPLLKSFDLRDHNKWKECTVLLVTDGEAPITDPQRIRELTGKKTSLQAVLIGRARLMGGQESEDLFDNIYQTKMNQLSLTLVEAAKGIM